MSGGTENPSQGYDDTELTDRMLVARLKDGDETAATELYRRYAGRLHGLADRQMSAGIRRTHEPDDSVQSAFRSLFRGGSSGSYDAIEFLQPLEREIVAMRVQGFTVEEIGVRVDRSCRTVQRTLQRIREKLSEKFMEDCEIPD